MRNDELLTRILKTLSQLITEIKLNNGAGRMDLNKAAEDFYCGLLNIILGNGIALTNMNHIHEDFPSIDLGDPCKGIAVQVTSTERRDKIRTTLKKFFEQGLDRIFSERLIILIIGRADTYSKDFITERGFNFDPAQDIWDENALGREINKLDLDALEILDAYLAKYLPQHCQHVPALHLPVLSAVGLTSFLGREDELNLIKESLDTGVKPVVLSGLGGIGKTELAAEFARNYTDGNVYFVTFRGSFTKTLALGVTEGISDLPTKLTEEDACQAALNRLQTCRKNDILIIDNVDKDHSSFSQLKKDPMYKALSDLDLGLILTTRYDIPRAIQINRLKNEELYRIFESYEAPISKTDMDDLIEAVSGHTMTIDLIARMMVGSWKKISSEQFLDALRKNNLTQFQRKVGTDRNRDTEQRKIYDHLKVVFDLADIPDIAKNVLCYATLLPNGGMNSESFGSALQENEQDALDDLIQHGWLSLRGELLSIHPIIRLICREELQPTAKNCELFLVSVAEQIDYNLYDSVQYRQWAELFTLAADIVPDQNGNSILLAGRLWGELGMLEKALILNLRLVSLQEQISKPDSQMLATAYNNLATTYEDLGDYGKQLEFSLKALKILEDAHTQNDRILARSYGNVGLAYRHQNDPETALNYLLKAIRIEEQLLPANHPDLARTYNSIGGIYGQLNNHYQALEFMQKALTIREIELPGDHPLLASSYNNVGFTYEKLGDVEKALHYMLKALEIREHILPENHPDLALSYSNVGYTYGSLGDSENALKYSLKAIMIREKFLPRNHPDLATSYDNVSNIYIDIGNYEKALEYQMRALDIHEKRLLGLHPDLAHLYNKISRTYGKLNNSGKELEYLLKALKIWDQPLPEYQSYRAIVCGNIASTLIDLKQFEEAAKYAHLSSKYAALAFPESNPKGEPFPQYAQMMVLLAECLEQGIDPADLPDACVPV